MIVIVPATTAITETETGMKKWKKKKKRTVLRSVAATIITTTITETGMKNLGEFSKERKALKSVNGDEV
jgi:accessory gene regulator protein AgrB